MIASAQQKADKFLDDCSIFIEIEYKDRLKYELTQLLLEHERDTRYTAIDIIRNMEQLDVEVSGSMFEEQHYYQDCVNTEETINNIHNMKVGFGE